MLKLLYSNKFWTPSSFFGTCGTPTFPLFATFSPHFSPHSRQTFGEKLVVFGLALRGMALLPRFAPAAQVLRFAGVGPMAVGAAVSLYELGGWRLLLAVPGSVGLAVSASVLTEKKLEENLGFLNFECVHLAGEVLFLADQCIIYLVDFQSLVNVPCFVTWKLLPM